MTQAARLQEMAHLVEGNKGTEMIKSLSAEAVEAMDPEKEHAHMGAFMPVEEIVTPFMNHLKALQTSFPELNPWTEKVEGFSSFLQKDSLESMFGSNLPGFRKYKQEFQGYKKEHQEQILDFMEMFQMDDILTVLQSP